MGGEDETAETVCGEERDVRIGDDDDNDDDDDDSIGDDDTSEGGLA